MSLPQRDPLYSRHPKEEPPAVDNSPKEAPRSPSRSPLTRRKRSPTKPKEERKVTFQEEVHTETVPGRMRMSVSQARKQTPRFTNETKKAWKDRVFKTARGET